jgi:nitrogen fixation protein NifU and related proteins
MNDQVYKENILDHYKNPRNVGSITNSDYQTKLANYSCGDETTISFNVEKGTNNTSKENIITEIKHQTVGCAICMASTSILSEELVGKGISEIKKLDKDYVLEQLGIKLTPSRLKCALLPLEAIKIAIKEKAKAEK